MQTASTAKVVSAQEVVEEPLPPRIQKALGDLVGAAKEGLLALGVEERRDQAWRNNPRQANWSERPLCGRSQRSRLPRGEAAAELAVDVGEERRRFTRRPRRRRARTPNGGAPHGCRNRRLRCRWRFAAAGPTGYPA